MKTFYIETYGCQMNVADSEVVGSILKMDGFELSSDATNSDLILINTCSIRDNAEQKVLSRLQYFNSLRKKRPNLIIGVIGCMAERVQTEMIKKHMHQNHNKTNHEQYNNNEATQNKKKKPQKLSKF